MTYAFLRFGQGYLGMLEHINVTSNTFVRLGMQVRIDIEINEVTNGQADTLGRSQKADLGRIIVGERPTRNEELLLLVIAFLLDDGNGTILANLTDDPHFHVVNLILLLDRIRSVLKRQRPEKKKLFHKMIQH